MPEFYLKKYILESFPEESEHAETVDFVVDQLETLNRQDLGSRLTLNCLKSRLGDTSRMDQSKITLIDVCCYASHAQLGRSCLSPHNHDLFVCCCLVIVKRRCGTARGNA